MVEFNCLKPFTKASKSHTKHSHSTVSQEYSEKNWEFARKQTHNISVKCRYSIYSTLDFTGRFQFHWKHWKHLRGLYCTTEANLIYTIRMTASKGKTYYTSFKQVIFNTSASEKVGIIPLKSHYSWIFYFILIIHSK